jgi:hypothetical protein
MNPQVFAILCAASSGDYKTLKNLPKLEVTSKDYEQVEQIIRNMVLKNKDRKLLNSFPIKARVALLDAVDYPDVFEFLLLNLFKGKHYSLDFPDYVTEKIEDEKIFKLLIENKIDFHYTALTEKGKIEYLKTLEDYEIIPKLAAIILEDLLDKNENINKDNYFIKVLSDSGYNLPKRKNGQSVTDRVWQLYDELRNQ